MADLLKEQWEERLHQLEEISIANVRNNIPEKYYCFLDFDGVINIWDQPIGAMEKSIKEAEFQMLNKDCVKRLSDFCKEYNIHVVISSSWRFNGLEYCQRFLRYGGLDESIPIVGTTALDLDVNREMHITDYLFAHPDFTNYFIIDDIRFDYLDSHLIKCDSLKGYDEEKSFESHRIIQKFREMSAKVENMKRG